MSYGAFDANLFVPRSSIEHAWDIGQRAHTNFIVYDGPEFFPNHEDPIVAELMIPPHGPAVSAATPAGFHPTDYQSAYGDRGAGSGTIAIVDAYHFPTSLSDFNTFSTMFGLPTEASSTATANSNAVFQVVYASGSQPAVDAGWSQEMALDIEWAHAMAPGAKIVLVEAATSNFSDLMHAIDVASALPGVTQVSMSWGGSEFSSEAAYDSHFNHPAITYFASTGDVGGAKNYPATSPAVVAVGGTSLTFINNLPVEHGWTGSGGGASTVERMPSFQNMIMSVLHGRRGVPDVAAVADPNTGASVYDSTPNQGFVGWFVVGGTSLSCPLCAAMANAGGAKHGSAELSYIYSHASGFTDITAGASGPNTCHRGWDMVTGWGTPKSSGSL